MRQEDKKDMDYLAEKLSMVLHGRQSNLAVASLLMALANVVSQCPPREQKYLIQRVANVVGGMAKDCEEEEHLMKSEGTKH